MACGGELFKSFQGVLCDKKASLVQFGRACFMEAPLGAYALSIPSTFWRDDWGKHRVGSRCLFDPSRENVTVDAGLKERTCAHVFGLKNFFSKRADNVCSTDVCSTVYVTFRASFFDVPGR